MRRKSEGKLKQHKLRDIDNKRAPRRILTPPKGKVRIIHHSDIAPSVGDRVYGHFGTSGKVFGCGWDKCQGKHLFLCEGVDPLEDESLGWNVVVQRIIAQDADIPAAALNDIPVNLATYKGKLPEGLKKVFLIDGDLAAYPHPLPATLTTLDGGCYLGGYRFPLPDSLKTMGPPNGDLLFEFGGYNFALPPGLRMIYGGEVNLAGYEFPLPKQLMIDGVIYGPYELPLPPLLAAKEVDEQVEKLLPELNDIFSGLEEIISKVKAMPHFTKKQQGFCSSLTYRLRKVLNVVKAARQSIATRE